MENCYGKPGPCLPRWTAVAVGIWMLWTIVPLVESSADSCPDLPGVDIHCPLNELAGVNCTYVKGLHAERTASYNMSFPGSVKQLTVQPYLNNNYRTENFIPTYLNITWKIDALDFRNLTGFLLNVTFKYGGIQRYIYRTYSLSVENWNDRNIFETAFRHECIVPLTSADYRIEVLSLPLSTNNAAAIHLRTEVKPDTFHDNPVSTYDWIASMWMTRSLAEDKSLSSVDVCFFFAPLSFGFQQYRMSLMHANTSVLQLTLQSVFIYDNGTQKRHACVTFGNVCPGIYKVYLLPLAEFGSCTCRTGPNDCRDSCTATLFEPIDMRESVCKPPGSSPPPPKTTAPPPNTTALPPNTTTALPLTPGHRSITPPAVMESNRNETSGIVVAATGAGVVVIVSAVVVSVILVILCRRRDKVSFGTHSAAAPFLTPDKQPAI